MRVRRLNQVTIVEDTPECRVGFPILLSCQLASMQVQLLAMLDEIANAAAKIETRCQDLTGNLEQVNEHSTLQYDSAKSVAAATEQLSVSVREVAHGSQDATASAQKAQQLIDAGNGEISAAVDMTNEAPPQTDE